MVVKNFEELEIWKEARRLTCEIYDLSKTPKFSKDFGLRNQMQRTAYQLCRMSQKDLSAEENQEFVQFLYVAKGSCVSCGLSSAGAGSRLCRSEDSG
jgi:four helix bundle protein